MKKDLTVKDFKRGTGFSMNVSYTFNEVLNITVIFK
jgi:hypothetical protein